MTQIEWIDSCAHELAADGIVLDVRHFPRTDGDYLAQIKKMAVDCGLAIAAVYDAALYAGDHGPTLAAALALGAPIVAAPLPQQTAMSWSDALGRVGEAAAAAKRLNVTLALRNAVGSLAAGSAEMKAAAKETDSAWLRFGPEPQTLEAGSDLTTLLARSVLIWQHIGSPSIAPEQLQGFNAWVVLDDPAGTATLATATTALGML